MSHRGCGCCGGVTCNCGEAIWQWNTTERAWEPVSNTCTNECIPQIPTSEGTENGQQRMTCCICPECGGSLWEWKEFENLIEFTMSGWEDCPDSVAPSYFCSGNKNAISNKTITYTKDAGTEFVTDGVTTQQGNRFTWQYSRVTDGQSTPQQAYVEFSVTAQSWQIQVQVDSTSYNIGSFGGFGPEGSEIQVRPCYVGPPGGGNINTCSSIDPPTQVLNSWRVCGNPWSCCGSASGSGA